MLCAPLAGEIALLETVIAGLLEDHQGCQAVRALPGTGLVPGAVIVAEIGDVTRVRRPAGLCSWAGLTPGTASPAVKVARGHITRTGVELASSYEDPGTQIAAPRSMVTRRNRIRSPSAVGLHEEVQVRDNLMARWPGA